MLTFTAGIYLGLVINQKYKDKIPKLNNPMDVIKKINKFLEEECGDDDEKK